jgi:hypothetical protein
MFFYCHILNYITVYRKDLKVYYPILTVILNKNMKRNNFKNMTFIVLHFKNIYENMT